jgi:hypothetical protein
MVKMDSLAWWFMPIIPARRKLRQENCEFKASLGYTVITCLKKRGQRVKMVNFSLFVCCYNFKNK